MKNNLPSAYERQRRIVFGYLVQEKEWMRANGIVPGTRSHFRKQANSFGDVDIYVYYPSTRGRYIFLPKQEFLIGTIWNFDNTAPRVGLRLFFR